MVTTPLEARFILSAPGLRALPAATAEVAVIGRSNVGKSSLINALCHRRDLAQTSNTPGRTQLINLYELSPASGGGTIVDLPGYGYAAASKRTRSTWPQMIEGYLLGRDALRMVMVLVDAEIGPTKLDVQALDWLRGHGLAHAVIATKQDKVKSSHRLRRRDELAAGCGLVAGEVMWVSATKGTGVPELRSRVRTWLVDSPP
jgi:GTP-binding protein